MVSGNAVFTGNGLMFGPRTTSVSNDGGTTILSFTRKLEGIVLEQLKATFEGKLEINITPKAIDPAIPNEYDILTERLKKLEAREERIKIAFQDGIDTAEEYKANKASITEERQAITAKLELMKKTAIQSKVKKGFYKEIKNVYALLTDPKIDIEIKHKTASFLIQNITFTKQENLLEIKYR